MTEYNIKAKRLGATWEIEWRGDEVAAALDYTGWQAASKPTIATGIEFWRARSSPSCTVRIRRPTDSERVRVLILIVLWSCDFVEKESTRTVDEMGNDRSRHNFILL